MHYWLFKSEAKCFSYDDLANAPKKTTSWDGVRNYQARNFMRDEMKEGDLGIFYHSNGALPHAIGTVKIVHEGYPDSTAWDPLSEHPDAASSAKNPRWFMVDVQAEGKFKNPVFLSAMRTIPILEDMPLLRRGNRLSVMPISKIHFLTLCSMGSENKK
ncbi:MAG: EVE domain-containing protein [Candidatus Peregrinibacteria bacterium]